jgi:hypothetical protein
MGNKKPIRQGWGKGAGEGSRTLDIHVGNVMLYQLSYARTIANVILAAAKVKTNASA